jgi:hypothetical protein
MQDIDVICDHGSATGYGGEEPMVRAILSEHGKLCDLGARIVAGWWHGGQSSALYSLASCGAIRSDCEAEILSDLGVVTDADSQYLAELSSYVADHGERGPQEGWSDLHY